MTEARLTLRQVAVCVHLYLQAATSTEQLLIPLGAS